MKNSKSPVKNNSNNNNSGNQQKENSNNHNNCGNVGPICDICVQDVPGPEREKIFAFGKCDHHVCYVCSARLRAICDQFECPICREKLENVVFSSNKNRPFEKCNLKDCLYNEKHRIYFENETIKSAYEKLLKFECLECLKGVANKQSANKQPVKMSSLANEQSNSTIEFSDVFELKRHLNSVHKLKLCDLCLTHNKLFPFEYSYYDASSLRKHMKDGEPKTSHRGHPNCSLCHNTFFNTDELVQHMSREHFHCHLCGRHDSNMLIYFLDYESLRQHFKSKHFLCERDNCRHEQFTPAFDSQIDLQLHIVQVHGNSTTSLSRGEARQQRTITLDSAPHRAVATRQSNLPRNAAVVSTGTAATANNPRQQVPESIQAQVRQQRLPSRADFPALGFTGPGSSSSTLTHSYGNQYPSLAQTDSYDQTSRSVTLSQRLIAGPSNSRGSFVRSAGGGYRPPEQLSEMDFPPLPEQPKPKGNQKSKVQQKARNNRDDGLTLDLLISSSLTLSSRKNNSRNKPNKSSKPKALKIQL